MSGVNKMSQDAKYLECFRDYSGKYAGNSAQKIFGFDALLRFLRKLYYCAGCSLDLLEHEISIEKL